MYRHTIIFILAVISFTSCIKKEEETQPVKQEKKYDIEQIDEQKLGALIKDRKGKALFINVWATWCVPCIEEFPDIVKVAEHYKGSDVDIISLNVDMSSQVDSLVIPFLRSFKADFTVYNVKEKSAEKVINLLNEKWSGAIPATFIYDKNGNQKIFILGSEKYMNFRDAVDSVRSL